MTTQPTVRNPQSPFFGGVSQSNYSREEPGWRDDRDWLGSQPDADLYDLARALASLVEEPSVPEQDRSDFRGLLWIANDILAQRGLQRVKEDPLAPPGPALSETIFNTRP